MLVEPLQVADEMYFISKGEVSVLVSNGKCARGTGVEDLIGDVLCNESVYDHIYIYIYIYI